jgi:hypothetical protein
LALFTSSRQSPDADGPAGAAAGEKPDGAQPDGARPDEAEPDGAKPDVAQAGARSGRRTVLARVTTALAAVLVLLTLLLPNQLDRLTPGTFARIPVEGIGVAAVLLLAPPRARRVAALAAGALLGLLALLDVLDMGFSSVLVRPFDLVLDWPLLADAEGFLRDEVGPAGAVGAVIGAVLLAVAVPVLTALAVLRLSRLLVRHRRVSARTVLALGTVWALCAALGVPAASWDAARHFRDRALAVRTSLADERQFSKDASVDAFRGTPADRLLTGLRGKPRGSTRCRRTGPGGCARPGSPPGAPSSPRPPSAAAAGWPTPPSCPGCGSPTSSATAPSLPVTG